MAPKYPLPNLATEFSPQSRAELKSAVDGCLEMSPVSDCSSCCGGVLASGVVMVVVMYVVVMMLVVVITVVI